MNLKWQSRFVQNSDFLHISATVCQREIKNKRSPIEFIKKCERCQTCKLSEWLLHVRQWCLSLSQIPQALINQDLNTPFDPVIVSLRKTAKLNGKIWFLYSREDYKADATFISLKHSKHICSKEHLHITWVKKNILSVFLSNLCISELNNVFTNFHDILIVQNLAFLSEYTHSRMLLHTHTHI